MSNYKDRMEVVQGDICKFAVDAIVNAANSSLLGGGGVDGAIHRAAGPDLVQECRMLRGCKTGEAKISRGYRLPATFVIHTVGPVWNGGTRNEDALLENCYRNCLRLAEENDFRTIAFPAISCGIYRFPIPRAADIALSTTELFLTTNTSLERVIFVCREAPVLLAYQESLESRI